MTHPPTRAEQVRMTSTQSSRAQPPGVKMTAIDLDDDNVRPDAWFAYVLPVQSGVEMMGSGRYGYWERQPSVDFEDECIVITGRSDTLRDTTERIGDQTVVHDDGPGGEEPILVLPRASVISVLIAKTKHIEAMPMPQVRVQEPGN